MRTALLALAWLSLASLASPRQGGITYTPVLDNETVEVTRFHAPPSTSELLQNWADPFLFILLTPGDVDLRVGTDNGRGHYAAGTVTFVPAGVFHRARNIGTTTFDMLLIKIKPARRKAPGAPATEAPPGTTRTTILDNADVRVVRVRFAPGGREPLHTHPNDLLTVQLEAGRLEILNGSERTTGNLEVGVVKFLSRGVEHSYGSVDTNPFDILSVSIK